MLYKAIVYALLLLAEYTSCQDTISRQQTCQRLNNVFQGICQDVSVGTVGKIQGVPGKRGPKGHKGDLGERGEKGDNGVVDYTHVDDVISRKVEEQLRSLNQKMENLEETVQELKKTIKLGQSEVSPTATCTNKWETEPVDYMYIGCYKEQTPWRGTRVIPPVEGRFPTVTGSYSSRTNPIEKCAKVASCLGYKVFVIQAGGWCATSADAHKVYGKYGPSNACALDGEGAGGTNAVYMLI